MSNKMTNKVPTIIKYINELTPHPDNYNSHPQGQITQLAESLTTFGQFKNIVVWTCPANMTTPDEVELHEGLCYILAGHGLWLAAMEAGFDELEVKDYSGLSYEMALTLLMVDNAAPLGSEPIPEKLAALMERTRELVADRPGLAGMLAELKAKAGVNGKQAGRDVKPQIDKAAQLKEKWGTALGQVWQLGEHRLAVGDCTERAVVESVMRGERARFEFSDPPYELETKGGGILKDAPQMRAIEKAGIDKFNPESLQLLTQTALFCCNKPLIPGYIDLAKKLKVAWDICFYKKENTPPNYGGHLMTDTEYLMVLGDQSPNSGQEKQLYSKAYLGQPDFDAAVAWAKPVGLAEKFIRLYSSPGQNVIDRYLGSGSTLIACENLGRKCRACEIDPGYVAIAIQRWVDLTNQEPRLINP